MKLIPIQPDNMKLAWKDVAHHIEKGLEYTHGKYVLDDIKELILSKELTLWVIYNDTIQKAVGCLLTQLLQYPQMRCLSVFLMSADDFDEAVTLLDDLKENAKMAECKSIELYGRVGWEKLLKPFDFEKIHTVMRLSL
jgi:hypothetical protein